MMSSIHVDIDAIRKQMLSDKINNEIDDLNIQNPIDHERIEQLKYIKDKKCRIMTTETIGEQNNIENMFNIIELDSYKKFWIKLLKNQKIMKIREYIAQNYQGNKELEELLINNIDKLTSAKQIKYDKNNAVITSIPILVSDDSGFKLKI